MIGKPFSISSARNRRRGGAGLAIFLTLAVLLLVGAAVVIFVWKPWASPKPLSTEQQLYLPDNPQFLASVDVEGFLKSDVYRQLNQALKKKNGKDISEMAQEMRDKIGLSLEDIKSVTLGGQLDPNGPPTVFAGVVLTKKAVNAEALAKQLFQGNPQSVDVNGRKMYFGEGKMQGPEMALCAPDSTTLVVGPKAVVEAILKRGKGPTIPEGLKTAMSQTDFSSTLAAAASGLPPELRQKGLQGMGPQTPPQIRTAVENLDGGALEIQVGSDISFKVSGFFKDAKAAKDLADFLNTQLAETKKNLQQAPPQFQRVQRVVNSIAISSSGNKVTISGTVDADTLTEGLNQIR